MDRPYRPEDRHVVEPADALANLRREALPLEVRWVAIDANDPDEMQGIDKGARFAH